MYNLFFNQYTIKIGDAIGKAPSGNVYNNEVQMHCVFLVLFVCVYILLCLHVFDSEY